MLLRRITQHVRNQNWFAVFIDFFIVVVGVFIGIQVANWNEERKLKQFETVVLKELLITFEDNIHSLTEDFELNQRAIDSNQFITHALENNVDYDDSFDLHFANIQYNVNIGLTKDGFDLLDSYGNEIISNLELRNNVIMVQRWTDYLKQLSDKNEQQSLHQFTPKYKTYFRNFKMVKNTLNQHAFEPKSYADLIGNEVFLQELAYQRFVNETSQGRLNQGMQFINEIIQDLKTELSK